jgi:hypothetical protein
LAIDLGYQNVEVESGMEEFIKLIEETRWWKWKSISYARHFIVLSFY